MEENKINLIDPVEWENTHIESHRELNRYVRQFYSRLNNIDNKIDEALASIRNVDEDKSSAFSKINKIEKDIEYIHETLGCMAEEIKNLKDNCNKWRKYIVKNFEWILDTDTEALVELEKIELDGVYLVNIVENEIIKNDSTIAYSIWHTAIANGEYTPRVYICSKIWWHAVFEYDFTVILTEI